jgi:hypothetical protein
VEREGSVCKTAAITKKNPAGAARGKRRAMDVAMDVKKIIDSSGCDRATEMVFESCSLANTVHHTGPRPVIIFVEQHSPFLRSQ